MNEYLLQTQDHLKKIFPHLNDVQIKVLQEKNKTFVAIIKINASYKRIFAKKRGENYFEVVNKALKAIVHQLQKSKVRFEKKHYVSLKYV